MAEHILEITRPTKTGDLVAELAERAGATVKLRIGRRFVVVAAGRPPTELPDGVRLLSPEQVDDLVRREPDAADVAGLAAHRLRRSETFRAGKRRRPHDGQSWDAPGRLPPDGGDESPVRTGPPHPERSRPLDATGPPAPGGTGLADAAPDAPLSGRMINSVAVGLVFVDAPVGSPYDLTADERTKALAEAQDGLDWLTDQQPDAKISWVIDSTTRTVDIVPWTGARWPGMPDSFYGGIDTALLREDNGKIYFFKGDQYVRFSSVSDGVDAGYPKPIAGNWPGLPAAFQAGIDAALWRQSNNKLYLFKGNQYVRFTDVSAGVDAGYPKPIAGNWPGLPAAFEAGIDAALLRKDNGKIYFFKGDQYVRFSDVSAGVDAGYPKPIEGNWPGLPGKFQTGIDAALWRNSNSKLYLFKDRDYVRFSDVSAGVDDGYPLPIGLSRTEAEALWRDPAMAQLGYKDGITGVEQYARDLRNEHATSWAYVAFLTRWPVTWFAYAGSPRIVMHYDNDGWGPDNIDRVFAHETGHIFGAPDEYASSNCACATLAGRFYRHPNGNCANCPDPTDPCIMKSNSQAICAFTPKHFGWGPFLTKVDAALWRVDNNRAYLFGGDEYVRYTDIAAGRDANYPTKISPNWSGLPTAFQAGIDAALWREDNNRLYFFKGNQYVRFTDVSAGVDAGYPKPIAGNWPGLPAAFQAGIDAALWRESNGKVYLFKGNEYVRFSSVSAGVDAGYPKPIAGNWPGLPASFQAGIDAALMRKDNHKIYFFKGTRYVRFTDVAAGVDPGYPAWIDGNWLPFPR